VAKRYENDCVGCDTYCINCGRKETPHWYCDECGEEFELDELYETENGQLCAVCVLKMFEKVKVD
jgi:DNA-directed RNA polymerase subunit RPC12/RpoP